MTFQFIGSAVLLYPDIGIEWKPVTTSLVLFPTP